MVRGMYTGASSMVAQQVNLDVISNNIANVDKTAFKRNTVAFESFPQMLLARTKDDGLTILPIGSTDIRPFVGQLGTGVEVNEVFTEWEQGSLKATSNPLDLALEGQGFFVVETDEGERYTRNGSFLIDKDFFLVTKDGYKVLGENGAIQLKHNNFMIDELGRISVNSDFQSDESRLVQTRENTWMGSEIIDSLRVVRFDIERYLTKEGDSLWKDNEVSGSAENQAVGSKERAKVVSGFLEMSNVNAVNEMVRMIEVQRAYELSSKVIQTEDALIDKAVNQVGAVN